MEFGIMKFKNNKLIREKKTVSVMIAIFCRKHHSAKTGSCPECEELNSYAARRVDHCIFGHEKPVCAKCPVHCYKPEMRDKIKAVMRFSGPRMLLNHPVLTAFHLLDSRRSNLNNKG